MENLRESVLYYSRHFYMVDYVLFLFILLLFVCVLFLCIFLRHRPIAGLLIVAVDIVACFFIYIYGYRFIDSVARSRETGIIEQKILQSSNTLAVDFNITNTSKNNFKECKVTAKIFKDEPNRDNFFIEYKDKFIPYRQKSRGVRELKRNQTQNQRISFEDFTYEGNYTIRLNSECF